MIIHRAPFGSFERFIGILIEHFAGDFPLWLAPVQAVVIPITDAHAEYGKSIFEALKKADIRVEFDDRNEKIGYRIRDWELKKAPYMLVVGEKEKAAGTIAVRQHKKGDLGSLAPGKFIEQIQNEIQQKSITA